MGVVAILRRGDSFGWPHLHGMDEDEISWEQSEPRVIVFDDGNPLRICRLHDSLGVSRRNSIKSSQQRGSVMNRVSAKRLSLCDVMSNIAMVREPLCFRDRLARLWVAASAPVVGVGYLSAGLPRCHFLASL